MILLSRIVLSAALICFLFTGYLIWERTNPTRLSFETFTPHPVTAATQLVPTRIAIPRLSIDLPIIPAEIRAGQWDTTTQGVSHLSTSAIPGETGNSILYGHNWRNLLGRLPNIQNGDEFYITMSDGSTRRFIVTATAIVRPEQTALLEPTGDTRLTLYTCIGIFDQNRFVLTSVPIQ